MDHSRVWLVTGTSGGIGLATVKAVLEAGHRAATTTRKSTPAAPLAALLATYGPSRLLVVQHDPSSAEATSGDEIVDRIDAHFGRLDVVVNNAGYGLNGVVESIDEAQARMQLEVNFWDPARISRAAVRYFREHNTPANGGNGGRIIQVSSSGGFSPSPTLAHYSASKFALNAFSEALHKELDPAWNIKLIVVQPGGVRTDWAGASMNRVPLPPAYADPNGIPAQFRKAALDSTYMNDADKVGKVFLKLVEIPNPPLRLPMGPDARFVIQDKLDDIQREMDQWKELELESTADDADPHFFDNLKKIAEMKERSLGK